jgi:glycerol-3-phosphate dehydrogenase (NAD(P)+)
VAVLGAGSWGTTFAKILVDGGSDVALWARRPEVAREICQSKRNSGYLPGVNLPRNLWSSSSLPDVLEGAQIVFVSVPSQSLRENLAAVRDLLPPRWAPGRA